MASSELRDTFEDVTLCPLTVDKHKQTQQVERSNNESYYQDDYGRRIDVY